MGGSGSYGCILLKTQHREERIIIGFLKRVIFSVRWSELRISSYFSIKAWGWGWGEGGERIEEQEER